MNSRVKTSVLALIAGLGCSLAPGFLYTRPATLGGMSAPGARELPKFLTIECRTLLGLGRERRLQKLAGFEEYVREDSY